MFWKIAIEEGGETPANLDGRFVLQRHCDADGPHLDLRLEQDGYLVGWRIDGVTLSETCWATEKGPHPLHWLDQDGDAVREDGGGYAWLDRDARSGELLLQGESGTVRLLRVEREAGLPVGVIRSVAEAVSACGVDASEAGALIADGVTARRRVTERLCGLARELDGSAFDETVTRKVVAGLALDEMHAQLRSYEVRFDGKYPPQPVSRPERLPDEESVSRTETALAIAREG